MIALRCKKCGIIASFYSERLSGVLAIGANHLSHAAETDWNGKPEEHEIFVEQTP